MDHEEVLAALVEECQKGWVGLWWIVNAARFDICALEMEDARAWTLILVRELVADHGMVAGQVEKGTFLPWTVSLKCLLDVIDYEWSLLGRFPKPDEIVWLTDPASLR